jgi:hypothetical protein
VSHCSSTIAACESARTVCHDAIIRNGDQQKSLMVALQLVVQDDAPAALGYSASSRRARSSSRRYAVFISVA